MFRFALDPVLNKHRLVEEQIQKDLAAAARKLREERLKLGVFEKEQSVCIEELERRKTVAPSVSELTVFMSFIDSLESRISAQKKEVDRAEAVFNDRRSELLEIFKRRRLLEKLRQKGLGEYTRVKGRREEAAMNEIAVQAYARR